MRSDLSFHIQKYFTSYAPLELGLSPATLDGYRYSVSALLKFFKAELGIASNDLKLSDLTNENVRRFLKQTEEQASVQTRNLRLAAIKSFIRYVQYIVPDYGDNYRQILGIKAKKLPEPVVNYLKEEGVNLFIKAIDRSTEKGFRDYVMLMVLLTTGIRVDELIHIKVKDLSLREPCTIAVTGKGRKSRYVTIVKPLIPFLEKYMFQHKLDRPEAVMEPLFPSPSGKIFTRQGINYIIHKYAEKARKDDPNHDIPDKLTAHSFRHTHAMHLVAEGADLLYIRDQLGHASVKTTEMYARANDKSKKEAVEELGAKLLEGESEKPVWEGDTNLQNWLDSLKFNKK